MWNYTRKGLRSCENTLETSGENLMIPCKFRSHRRIKLVYVCGLLWGPGCDRSRNIDLKFPTRFECNFKEFPTCFECNFKEFHTRFECTFTFMLPQGFLRSLSVSIRHRPKHIKQKAIVEPENYTRNWWIRCKTTLEMGGEDAKLHSKWVGKIQNYTRNGWGRCEITLETSGAN